MFACGAQRAHPGRAVCVQREQADRGDQLACPEECAVADLEDLTPYFKPEFLNRFDSIIRFNPLTEEDLLKIVSLMLEELQKTLKESGKTLEVSEEAKRKLVKFGYDPKFGARPLRRVIQEKVEDKIADVLLENDEITTMTIDVENDEIIVKQK